MSSGVLHLIFFDLERTGGGPYLGGPRKYPRPIRIWRGPWRLDIPRGQHQQRPPFEDWTVLVSCCDEQEVLSM